MKTIRIALTGGGSGGHVYPLLAVVSELKKAAQAHEVGLHFRYYGPADEYLRVVADVPDIDIFPIAGAKLRRYFALDNFLDIPRFGIALCQMFWKLYWYMPDVLFSKGGPGALAVVLMARWYRIPVVIHDSDAAPGLTNTISARFAKRIGVSFASAEQYFNPKKTFCSGNPIRPTFFDHQLDHAQAKRELGFDENVPLIVVLGGSQGSQRLNEFLMVNLPALLEIGQIYHQTGPDNYLEVKKLTQAELIEGSAGNKQRYLPVPYLGEPEMKLALAAADVVIARAGSGTIFEVAAFGRPAILIPLQGSANDHQRANAYAFATAGGGVVIEEDNLLPGIIVSQLKSILGDAAMNARMCQASSAFARPDAARAIAEEVLQVVIG